MYCTFGRRWPSPPASYDLIMESTLRSDGPRPTRDGGQRCATETGTAGAPGRAGSTRRTPHQASPCS